MLRFFGDRRKYTKIPSREPSIEPVFTIDSSSANSRSKSPSELRLKPRKSKLPLTTNNYSPVNAPSEHLPKMVDEFMYLDAHLTKLTKREEVERFKYYVKKRIYFYLSLLKSRKDKDTLNEYSMILINKIAKKLDSKFTKVYKYIRRQRAENVGKYFERSKPPSKNNRSAYKAPSNNTNYNFLNSLPPPSRIPKERTMIHLKRYLARIPHGNIQELLAFKDLFQDRMKAEQLENLKKNVKNIKNTIAIRIPGYMSPSVYTRGVKEAKRHFEQVEKKQLEKDAARKIKRIIKKHLVTKTKEKEEKEIKQQEKLRQSRERRRVIAELEQEAKKESAIRQKESANRRKASAERRAAVLVQSMHRMKSAKKLAQKEVKRRKNELQRRQKQKRQNDIHKAAEEEKQKREQAIRNRKEKERGRQEIQQQIKIIRNQTLLENFMKGKQISPKDRQRAAEMAIEAAFKQGPNRPPNRSPNRPGRLAVDIQTMARSPPISPRKVSSDINYKYVQPNTLFVNFPSFYGSARDNNKKTNKKTMIVVRSDPTQETLFEKLKRLSGDLFGDY